MQGLQGNDGDSGTDCSQWEWVSRTSGGRVFIRAENGECKEVSWASQSRRGGICLYFKASTASKSWQDILFCPSSCPYLGCFFCYVQQCPTICPFVGGRFSLEPTMKARGDDCGEPWIVFNACISSPHSPTPIKSLRTFCQNSYSQRSILGMQKDIWSSHLAEKVWRHRNVLAACVLHHFSYLFILWSHSAKLDSKKWH